MKITRVMSDIHGNYIALQRCLAHALARNVDAHIFWANDFQSEFPIRKERWRILYELKQNASLHFYKGK